MPVMVQVEVDDHAEHEEVTKVVLCEEEIDLARDFRGHFLVYDEEMRPVPGDAQENVHAMVLAEGRAYWPERLEWEEGPDPLRWPILYEDDDGAVDDAADDPEDGEEAAPATR
jgi:hypothetical protein